MDYYIITGASRGLGAAFVQTLLENQRETSQYIVCLSRHKNQALVEASERTTTKISWLECYTTLCHRNKPHIIFCVRTGSATEYYL